jgi:hypothetical protein
MGFLEQGRASAAGIAKDQEVELDEVVVHELRRIPGAFPRLPSRFQLSLALLLGQRLKSTPANSPAK